MIQEMIPLPVNSQVPKFACLTFSFRGISNLCRRESRVIRHRSYVRSFRFTLAALRASIFLLPLLWVVVTTTGQTLRIDALFLCIIGFSVLRDFASFKLLSVIVSCAEIKVSLSRLKVREVGVLRWRR